MTYDAKPLMEMADAGEEAFCCEEYNVGTDKKEKQASKSECKIQTIVKEKTKRYSQSRMESQMSKTDEPNCEVLKNRPNKSASSSGQVVNTTSPAPINDNFIESLSGKEKLSRHDLKKGPVKKERVKEGFQVYQVKKGKYSEKIEGIIDGELDKLNKDKRYAAKPRKSTENTSPEKYSFGQQSSETKNIRDVRKKVPSSSQNSMEIGNEKWPKNGKQQLQKKELDEKWDLDDETVCNGNDVNIKTELEREKIPKEDTTMLKTHNLSKQQCLEENWDLPNPSSDQNQIFPLLNQDKGVIKIETKDSNDKIKSKLEENRTPLSKNKIQNSNEVTPGFRSKLDKQEPKKDKLSNTVSMKNKVQIGRVIANELSSTIEPKERRQPRRGLGRGRRSNEGKSDLGVVIKHGSGTDDAKKQLKVNVKDQQKMSDDKDKIDSFKRKVTFSEEDQRVNEDIHDVESESLPQSKTAGIIVLPSPDVLKSEQSHNIGMDQELNQKRTRDKGKFTKLEKPSNYDAKHRKEVKSDMGTLHVKKGRNVTDRNNFIIPSSGGELWEKIKLECKIIKELLSKNFSSVEDIEEVLELSVFLQDLFKELIVKHQDFSFRNDVEGSLWKNTFHNVIQRFRTHLDEDANGFLSNEICQCYWNFLQNGDDFLQDLLVALQEEYRFQMDDFVSNALKMVGCKKQVKFAVRSCHLILLNLGDLERYITDLQQDNNYFKANKNYLQAQVLAPKNGKSYNQLAVVSVKCKKKLDAIYYYVRSLKASNPIESARERLTGIFQEIKRKADQTKKQNLEKSVSWAKVVTNHKTIKTEEDSSYRNDYSREDVWVFYRAEKYFKIKLGANGNIKEVTAENSLAKEEIDTQEKVSLREVNKEFLVYYLYMHSKFYTRIGFEYAMTVYEDAMDAFNVLLKHERASSMKKANLVKYMAINIFSVDNLVKKQEDDQTVLKDSPVDVAIIFGMDMCGLIAQRCAQLFEKNTDEAVKILEQFLPAVHSWMKWMCGYLDLIKSSSVCYMKDIWERIVTFFNAVRSFNVETVLECQDGEPVGLFEDNFLSGFQPLVDMEQPSMNVSIDDKCKAETFMRMESFKDLTFMISDSNKLPVVFNEIHSKFEVITPKIVYSSPSKNGNIILLDENVKDAEDEDSDVIIEDVSEDIDDRDLQYFRELKAKKMELTTKINDQEKKKQERAAIVETNASQVHMISENHPKYIVPDTNCFIDNLEGLVRIIDSKDFIVILPLIVINELDGLKKGGDVTKKYLSETHASELKARARDAVELLENRFSARDSQLKALTSVGTELDTISFRDEELTRDQGKNDDIILSCCLHFCEEAVNRFSSPNEPLVVQRKVVLLTDDRNLRLKAHSRHVPTISLNMFLKMAKLI